jgi:hypothetical protein
MLKLNAALKTQTIHISKMKNPPMIHLTVLLLLLKTFLSVAQSSPVPETVEFAGINVTIS